ncbi:MAG: RNA polymerase sigma factor [Planctomycetota bacterium]
MDRPPGPDETADPLEALSRALRRGEDVLGDWYRVAFPRVRRLARGFLAARDGADDVAQDVMLHLVDTIDRWNPEHAFAAWQRRVVLNRCRNQDRAARRRRSHEETAGAAWHEGALPTPDEAAERGELGSLIDRALGLLPRREREVFVLVELEGASPTDAADVLEVAPSTVRAALTLARRRLRDALAPHLAEGGTA